MNLYQKLLLSDKKQKKTLEIMFFVRLITLILALSAVGVFVYFVVYPKEIITFFSGQIIFELMDIIYFAIAAFCALLFFVMTAVYYSFLNKNRKLENEKFTKEKDTAKFAANICLSNCYNQYSDKRKKRTGILNILSAVLVSLAFLGAAASLTLFLLDLKDYSSLTIFISMWSLAVFFLVKLLIYILEIPLKKDFRSEAKVEICILSDKDVKEKDLGIKRAFRSKRKAIYSLSADKQSKFLYTNDKLREKANKIETLHFFLNILAVLIVVGVGAAVALLGDITLTLPAMTLAVMVTIVPIYFVFNNLTAARVTGQFKVFDSDIAKYSLNSRFATSFIQYKQKQSGAAGIFAVIFAFLSLVVAAGNSIFSFTMLYIENSALIVLQIAFAVLFVLLVVVLFLQRNSYNKSSIQNILLLEAKYTGKKLVFNPSLKVPVQPKPDTENKEAPVIKPPADSKTQPAPQAKPAPAQQKAGEVKAETKQESKKAEKASKADGVKAGAFNEEFSKMFGDDVKKEGIKVDEEAYKKMFGEKKNDNIKDLFKNIEISSENGEKLSAKERVAKRLAAEEELLNRQVDLGQSSGSNEKKSDEVEKIIIANDVPKQSKTEFLSDDWADSELANNESGNESAKPEENKTSDAEQNETGTASASQAQDEPIIMGGAPTQDEPIIMGGAPTQDEPIIMGGAPTQDEPIIMGGAPIQDEPIVMGGAPTQDEPIIMGGAPTQDEPIIMGGALVQDEPIIMGGALVQDEPIIMGGAPTQDEPIIMGGAPTQDEPIIMGGAAVEDMYSGFNNNGSNNFNNTANSTIISANSASGIRPEPIVRTSVPNPSVGVKPTSPIRPTGASGAVPPIRPAGTNGAVPPVRPIGATGGVPPVRPTGANGTVPPVRPTGANGTVPPVRPTGASGTVPPVRPTGASGAVPPIRPTGTSGAVPPVRPAGTSGAVPPIRPAGTSGAVPPVRPTGAGVRPIPPIKPAATNAPPLRPAGAANTRPVPPPPRPAGAAPSGSVPPVRPMARPMPPNGNRTE